jgi:hypothetical protein
VLGTHGSEVLATASCAARAGAYYSVLTTQDMIKAIRSIDGNPPWPQRALFTGF